MNEDYELKFMAMDGPVMSSHYFQANGFNIFRIVSAAMGCQVGEIPTVAHHWYIRDTGSEQINDRLKVHQQFPGR